LRGVADERQIDGTRIASGRPDGDHHNVALLDSRSRFIREPQPAEPRALLQQTLQTLLAKRNLPPFCRADPLSIDIDADRLMTQLS
jgi:hypothetical protein